MDNYGNIIYRVIHVNGSGSVARLHFQRVSQVEQMCYFSIYSLIAWDSTFELPLLAQTVFQPLRKLTRHLPATCCRVVWVC
jgi:hypothetical protein